MQVFSVDEAKSNLSKLLDMVLEGEEVAISRHGKPVAKLTPNPDTDRRAGSWFRSRIRQNLARGLG